MSYPLIFQAARQRLIDYLLMKVEGNDWHGVSDAANDLRELEAYQHGLDCARQAVQGNAVDTASALNECSPR